MNHKSTDEECVLWIMRRCNSMLQFMS
eukprot:SAG22_NODE_11212_length_495_cov_1.045455_1_plen_26_part_10